MSLSSVLPDDGPEWLPRSEDLDVLERVLSGAVPGDMGEESSTIWSTSLFDFDGVVGVIRWSQTNSEVIGTWSSTDDDDDDDDDGEEEEEEENGVGGANGDADDDDTDDDEEDAAGGGDDDDDDDDDDDGGGGEYDTELSEANATCACSAHVIEVSTTSTLSVAVSLFFGTSNVIRGTTSAAFLSSVQSTSWTLAPSWSESAMWSLSATETFPSLSNDSSSSIPLLSSRSEARSCSSSRGLRRTASSLADTWSIGSVFSIPLLSNQSVVLLTLSDMDSSAGRQSIVTHLSSTASGPFLTAEAASPGQGLVTLAVGDDFDDRQDWFSARCFVAAMMRSRTSWRNGRRQWRGPRDDAAYTLDRM